MPTVCWKTRKNEKKLTRSFNFTFRYIDDVLSINDYIFGDFVDRIYPIVVEIKDGTDIDKSIKNSSMLMISASENFLVESDCFLHNKICPFLAQGICIYVGHSF
jgi:hypothetical protein